MSGVTVGVVTIGQSPRDDIAPELAAVLGPDVHILESGCLDGLTAAEIGRLAPAPGAPMLVTRLSDGREVELGEERVAALVQGRVDGLEAAGAKVVAILCTGRLATLHSTCPLVEAHAVVTHFVAAVAAQRRLGVIVPAEEQRADAEAQWGAIAADVRVTAASPYRADGRLPAAARELRDWGAEAVLLDCLGFGAAAKTEVVRRAGVPVMLPRTLVARAVAELRTDA